MLSPQENKPLAKRQILWDPLMRGRVVKTIDTESRIVGGGGNGELLFNE